MSFEEAYPTLVEQTLCIANVTHQYLIPKVQHPDALLGWRQIRTSFSALTCKSHLRKILPTSSRRPTFLQFTALFIQVTRFRSYVLVYAQLLAGAQ